MNDSGNTLLDLRIDWADLDLFGHVNNVAFFKYIQAARVNYCELIGLTSLNEAGKPGFVVASSQCMFKKTLHYPGNITVHTKTDWIKNTSLQLSHQIINEKEELCAEAEDVLVVFDYNNRTKRIIDQDLKTAIQHLEQRGF